MDHSQLESKLTEVYQIGCKKEAEVTVYVEAVREQERISWQQSVETSLEKLKGIGEKRKELFMEYLKEELKKAGTCIR